MLDITMLDITMLDITMLELQSMDAATASARARCLVGSCCCCLSLITMHAGADYHCLLLITMHVGVACRCWLYVLRHSPPLPLPHFLSAERGDTISRRHTYLPGSRRHTQCYSIPRAVGRDATRRQTKPPNQSFARLPNGEHT